MAGTEESAPDLATLLSRVPEILYRYEPEKWQRSASSRRRKCRREESGEVATSSRLQCTVQALMRKRRSGADSPGRHFAVTNRGP
jgi:hypothetical protein